MQGKMNELAIGLSAVQVDGSLAFLVAITKLSSLCYLLVRYFVEGRGAFVLDFFLLYKYGISLI